MIEKIKSYGSALLGLAALVFAALFYRQKKETAVVESELAQEKVNALVKENDHAIEEQKAKSDSAVAEFRKLDGQG